MVTIQSQNFGVEIEMTGVSRGTAASVIANYFGVGGIHFAGGTYQTYEAKDSKGRVWKCMRDGSITPRRRIGGAIVEADDTYRCEVVTPILQYEDITDLQEVIRALVKKGAMANSSCGIHVHVDVNVGVHLVLLFKAGKESTHEAKKICSISSVSMWSSSHKPLISGAVKSVLFLILFRNP